MKIFASTKEKDFEFFSNYKNENHQLLFEGTELDFDIVPLGNGRFSLLKNNRSLLIHLSKTGEDYHMHVNGEHFEVQVEDERMRKVKELVQSADNATKELVVKAPIPGVIVQVSVEEGSQVQAGQPLLILEAMKMENVIKATCNCSVENILVSEKEAVQQNQELIRLVAG